MPGDLDRSRRRLGCSARSWAVLKMTLRRSSRDSRFVGLVCFQEVQGERPQFASQELTVCGMVRPLVGSFSRGANLLMGNLAFWANPKRGSNGVGSCFEGKEKYTINLRLDIGQVAELKLQVQRSA